ncbi:MAG TPA: OmpA family protein [Candidatus Binatia bacterium]|jgi:outer membrane protein OmpA-like peptidoglycan-associated protein|nr:OmpA family protein [Candidatus Binatia bacterium]
MRPCTLVAALALLSVVCLAEAADEGLPTQPQFTVHDLVFKVVDIGGAVRDLEVKESATEVRIELAADVLFDFDKADLRPEAQQTLQQAAEIIRDKTKGEVSIVGHTDAKGDDAYNMKLSDRRATSVKNWFAKNGNLGNRRMTTAGKGETEPVAPNTNPDGSDNPEGRQKNRRVEITIKK